MQRTFLRTSCCLALLLLCAAVVNASVEVENKSSGMKPHLDSTPQTKKPTEPPKPTEKPKEPFQIADLFPSVKKLPSGFEGWVQLLFLGGVYGYILMMSSGMIKDGSELLLLIPSWAGVVGSIVLPVLGAVPDGAIVLFSGMGPDAQSQLTIGVGALAGSTIMLLTVPWFLAMIAGRVNMDEEGHPNYVRPRGEAGRDWKKLDPTNKMAGTGVRCAPIIKYNAKIMVITSLSYLIILIPSMAANCIKSDEDHECKPRKWFALTGTITGFLLFVFYLWDQARQGGGDGAVQVQEDKVDQVRRNALNTGLVSLRGIFSAKVLSDLDQGIVDSGNKRFRAIMWPYFIKYDLNGDGTIDRSELTTVLRDLGENPSKENVNKIMDAIDTDRSGAIDFDEFCAAMVMIIQKEDIALHVAPVERRSSMVQMSANNSEGGDADENGSEDGEEEPEVPEDLADLSPDEQQKRIKRRAFTLMGVGVLITLLVSDPMVDVLTELGNRSHVPGFYVAFVLAPLASNASEVLAAYSYALKKTEKTMTISFSSLIGAACMNNTFCLLIFLMLVTVKDLKWEFSAETLSILLVELVMFGVAQRQSYKTPLAFMVLAIFPISIGFVALMENAVGLN